MKVTRRPLIGPVVCFLAAFWAIVLGTLARFRVLPFLRPDTTISQGQQIPTEQFAHFASNFLYVGGVVTLILGVVGIFILTEAHRRYVARLPRWQQWLIWPF